MRCGEEASAVGRGDCSCAGRDVSRQVSFQGLGTGGLCPALCSGAGDADEGGGLVAVTPCSVRQGRQGVVPRKQARQAAVGGQCGQNAPQALGQLQHAAPLCKALPAGLRSGHWGGIQEAGQSRGSGCADSRRSGGGGGLPSQEHGNVLGHAGGVPSLCVGVAGQQRKHWRKGGGRCGEQSAN